MKKLITIIFIIVLGISLSYSYELSGNTFPTQQEYIGFDTQLAFVHIKRLKESIQDIRQKLYELDDIIDNKDTYYFSTRDEIIKVIDDINNTIQALSKDLQSLHNYKVETEQLANKIQIIRGQQEETKQQIKNFANLIYQLHNELYDEGGGIDQIKIFIKGDNITQITSQELYINLMIQQLEQLLTNLSGEEKQLVNMLKLMQKGKDEVSNKILNYQQQIEKIELKKVYLDDFLTLYKQNKIELQAKLKELFQGRREIEEHMAHITIQILNHTFIPQTRHRGNRMQQLINLPQRGSESIFTLARPLLPIQKIEYYFQDPQFLETYNFNHNGLQIASKQGSTVHAPLDGLVIKAIDNMDFGINRMMILHRDNIITSYVYLNRITVQEGDIVKQGQVIGFSGGEPGAGGTGPMSKAANLTFFVSKNGKYMDPLQILDLSVINDIDIIPETLRLKYHKDIQKMPIDITTTSIMEGDTTRERRMNYLQTYTSGVYRSPGIWEEAAEGHFIDPTFVTCIVIAETSGGKNFASQNNPGNVGNPDDPNIRTDILTPLQGLQSIYDTLDNRMLGDLMKLDDLSGYGKFNDGQAVYATSKFNRQNNIQRCLTAIHGYYIPKNRPFRTAPKQRYSSSFEASSNVDYAKNFQK